MESFDEHNVFETMSGKAMREYVYGTLSMVLVFLRATSRACLIAPSLIFLTCFTTVEDVGLRAILNEIDT